MELINSQWTIIKIVLIFFSEKRLKWPDLKYFCCFIEKILLFLLLKILFKYMFITKRTVFILFWTKKSIWKTSRAFLGSKVVD